MSLCCSFENPNVFFLKTGEVFFWQLGGDFSYVCLQQCPMSTSRKGLAGWTIKWTMWYAMIATWYVMIADYSEYKKTAPHELSTFSYKIFHHHNHKSKPPPCLIITNFSSMFEEEKHHSSHHQLACWPSAAYERVYFQTTNCHLFFKVL